LSHFPLHFAFGPDRCGRGGGGGWSGERGSWVISFPPPRHLSNAKLRQLVELVSRRMPVEQTPIQTYSTSCRHNVSVHALGEKGTNSGNIKETQSLIKHGNL